MSLQTTKGFNYPQYTDTPDVPRDIYALASEIDNYLTTNRGPQGIQGFTGIQGIQGIQGLIGVQGIQGRQGIQGVQGLIGLQGVQGLIGLQGVYTVSTTPPAAPLTGTAWLNTNTGRLYVYDGLEWFEPYGNYLGVQGYNGPQGLQGPGASQGLQGPSGSTAKVTKSAVSLGNIPISTSFIETEITSVCQRGLVSLFNITADTPTQFDIEVRSSSSGGGTVMLSTAGFYGTSYNLSAPWYFEADSGNSMWIRVKNVSGSTANFTLTNLRVERFA
jgi:hypothetical protein